jgi:hypothetical protein
MATAKKTGKKKTPRKDSAEETQPDVGERPRKSKREKKPKKEKVPYVPNAERLTFFMGQLVLAGHVGKEIAEESSDRKRASLAIRQMAQQLDRQVHKTTS